MDEDMLDHDTVQCRQTQKRVFVLDERLEELEELHAASVRALSWCLVLLGVSVLALYYPGLLSRTAVVSGG